MFSKTESNMLTGPLFTCLQLDLAVQFSRVLYSLFTLKETFRTDATFKSIKRKPHPMHEMFWNEKRIQILSVGVVWEEPSCVDVTVHKHRPTACTVIKISSVSMRFMIMAICSRNIFRFIGWKSSFMSYLQPMYIYLLAQTSRVISTFHTMQS